MAGGGGGFAPAFGGHAPMMADFSGLPGMPHPTFEPLGGASGDADAGGFGAGGAWDTRAWERRQEENAGAEEVLCVDLCGGVLRAACWDAEGASGVAVPLGSGAELGAPSVLSFSAEATEKRLRRWLSETGRGLRAQGQLPKGVVCGRGSEGAAVVRSPLRLLGLRPGAGLEQEGRACGVAFSEKAPDDEGDGESLLSVRFKLSSEEVVELEPEALSAFVLSHLKARSEAPDEMSQESSGFCARGLALAVPGWWADGRRAALAAATSLAGLRLRRLCSRPLCVAVGLDEIDKLFTGKAKVVSVLILDANTESTEAAVLEGSEAESGLRTWRTLAAAGSPSYGNGEDGGEALGEAVRRASQDGLGLGDAQGLTGVVLCGDTKMTAQDVQEALEGKLGGSGAVKDVIVLRADAGIVALGLARIMAAELSAAGAPRVVVADALPEAIGVRALGAARGGGEARAASPDALEVEVLFERGAALPAKASRSYSRAASGGRDLSLKLVQRGPGGVWLPCLSLLEVLTGLDDDGEPAPCEVAVVGFCIDSGGILTAAVEETRGIPPPRSARRRRIFWLAMLFLLLVVGGAVGGYFRNLAARRDGYKARLRFFLRKHNPSRLGEAEAWLDKYAGTEDVLFRRLEKKYKASFPAASDAAGDSGVGVEEL